MSDFKKKFRIIKFKSKPILSLKSISKSFSQRIILRKIDIHLNKGEMLGLLGSNGAGKSTFMNIVLGLLKPDFGDIFLDNIKLNQLTNIIPLNCAVSNKLSKVKIFLRDDEASHSMYITNSNYVEVSSMTLDDFFKETKIKKCDFLKLDCEGAEYDIIDSLTPKNFEIIERIAIECHFANSKPLLIKNLTKILEMSSFDTKTKPIFSDMGFIFATRRH